MVINREISCKPNVRTVHNIIHLSDDQDLFFYFYRFGNESMNRVLRWMDKAEIPENAAILDIGTGNGAFLVEMV